MIDKSRRGKEVPDIGYFRRQTAKRWHEAAGKIGSDKNHSVYRQDSWKGWQDIEGKLCN